LPLTSNRVLDERGERLADVGRDIGVRGCVHEHDERYGQGETHAGGTSGE
jgi:hypothetical protein